MKIMIEQSSYSRLYENLIGVGRALSLLGNEVVMWNPNNQSVIDAMEEIKPSVFITFTPLKENAKYVMRSLKITDFTAITVANNIQCDPIKFSKLDPSSYFNCDVVGYIPFPECESIDGIKKYLAPTHPETFRLFSPAQQPSAKYCGWLPAQLHSLLLSSAKKVITVSQETAMNARLCNENVFINDEKFDINLQTMVREQSTLHSAYSLMITMCDLVDPSLENEVKLAEQKIEEFVNAF